MLAVSEPGHGDRIGRVAGQVVAAQPLDRDYPPLSKVGQSSLQRLFPMCRRGSVPRSPVAELRTAVRARHGLGVEAAVGRVAVLRLARRAERKLAHAGPGPVVRQIFDDRGPRAAVGAVGERVAIPPIGRVEQLAQAVVAGGDVGRKEAFGRGDGLALLDLEPRASGDLALCLPDQDLLHAGARRSVRQESTGEGLDRILRPGDLDLDLAGSIHDRAVESELSGKTPDERPEADALDDAVDLDRPDYAFDVRRGSHGTASTSSTSICSFAKSGSVSAPQLGQGGANSTDPNSASQVGQ